MLGQHVSSAEFARAPDAPDTAPAMDDEAILAALSQEYGLPREALRAATARCEELAPRFIRIIADYLDTPAAERPERAPVFFIFHLLGSWHEISAYPTLARLMRLPDAEQQRCLAEAITETAHRVMMSVFDGDPQPLFDVVLDREADEFARSRACCALAHLVLLGKLSREPVEAFARTGFQQFADQPANFVWSGWLDLVAKLGLDDQVPEVQRAFKDGRICPSWTNYGFFDGDLEQSRSEAGRAEWIDSDEYALFGDIIEELSGWHCFSDKYLEDVREYALRKARKAIADVLPVRPNSFGTPKPLPRLDFAVSQASARYDDSEIYNDEPIRGTKIGRNEPCPCTSGKKYKKCCGKA